MSLATSAAACNVIPSHIQLQDPQKHVSTSWLVSHGFALFNLLTYRDDARRSPMMHPMRNAYLLKHALTYILAFGNGPFAA